MNSPTGTVVSVNRQQSGSAAEILALVEVDVGTVCKRCASGKGCGAGLLGAGSQLKRIEAAVATDLAIKSGDYVQLSMLPRSVLRAVVIVYGYPLAGAVLGALVALAIVGQKGNDVAAAASALSGLAIGFVVAKVKLRNRRCLREFTPIVLQRLPAPPAIR